MKQISSLEAHLESNKAIRLPHIRLLNFHLLILSSISPRISSIQSFQLKFYNYFQSLLRATCLTDITILLKLGEELLNKQFSPGKCPPLC